MTKSYLVALAILAYLSWTSILPVKAAELGRSSPATVNNTRGVGSNPATGLQLSLCAPLQIFPDNYDVSGLRLNLLYGRNSNLRGLDLGLVNDVTGVAEGFQCGLVNLADDLSGLQVGVYNSASITANGFCQIGVANVGKDIRGVQLGVFNMCDTISGVQIGLLNFILQSDFVIFCPIINAQF